MSRCDRIRPDLSAFADGTLPPRRWEQVSYHLAGCRGCRDEVAEISRVCSTLSLCSRSAAPETLTARLESIAGEHSGAPLYMASGPGDLPSTRRRRVRLAAQSGAALLAVMLSAVMLAVLVAPDPVRLADPVKAAREQYSMSTAAISSTEAVGAVLLAHERGADLGEPTSYARRAAPGAGTRLTPEEAAALLRTATAADLTLSGVQRVWISDGEGRYRTADVRTTKVRGEGAQLEVMDARGDRFSSSFLPQFGATPVDAPDGWQFSLGTLPEQVAGRAAVRLVATDDGRAVASWWIDAVAHLVLWAERYDSAGAVSLAAGYTQLTLGSAEFHDDGLTQLISVQPASASQTEGWCVGPASCPLTLAGLPMVAYSSTERRGATSMNLVYSDGFQTAVVGWTDGVLGDDVTSQADQSAGLPAVNVWQSGPAVISVTTNGSPELMAAIREELPGEEPCVLTLRDRVAAGLVRLVGGE
ncbi:anti-sigma factor family protein [Tessaracoccus lapidicaptus]|uniref:anti-sigma factor family protein n=1 Tax=Tessaracoccus lapidicaptus TaxID=1427523 RepID=UPI0033418677